MNGTIIPAILWYLVTFTPEVPAAPIQLYGPLEHEECVQLERQATNTSWCQGLVIRKPESEKK